VSDALLARAALVLSLILAWANFLTTARWANQPGALHGWRKPWYTLALLILTWLVAANWRRIGTPVKLGRFSTLAIAVAGLGVLLLSLFSRLPISTWDQIPFKDDWTPLYQQAVNGIALLKRGAVVGWNWWLLGGYPTSTDIAQNFGTVGFIPMTLFGSEVGYHVLHAILFCAVPAFVWLDLRTEERERRIVATGLAGFFAAAYFGPLGDSGDTNSLVGVFCAGLAVVGGHGARLGSRWGGPVMLLGLTAALYTHTAFFVYGGIFLTIEAVYYRDWRALLRLAFAAGIALVAALPMHYESLRYPQFVSFNNTVYDPDIQRNWARFARLVYYNVEILFLPHRWFNDYRSIANVWLAALIAAALMSRGTRVGFYAWTAVVTQLILRFNTPEAGAGFDRIQHMFPMLTAPAFAGFVLRFTGARSVALSVVAALALFVQTSFAPIRHVETLRDWDPPLIDRIAASDGMVLVEISPHRDMDSHPTIRSQTTPFDVHFEGLLPSVAGQRFYSQSIDGWVWSIWRGQVVGAATFRGRPIGETPPDTFVAEMSKWGVRHLFVWTDQTREYLAGTAGFSERWREGRWSHFERADADTRTAVTRTGEARLANLDTLGADVELAGVKAGEPVVLRGNYYPAWRASANGRDVELFNSQGQLAFSAPANGTYVVRLDYPRYRALNVTAVIVLVVGLVLLAGRRRG
jgi:hypothetical protein